MISVRGVRRWVRLGVVATLVLAIVGCGSGPGSSPNGAAAGLVKIREAGFRVLYMWPLFLAKNQGFFRDEGLDFEYVEVDSGLLGVAALVSGDVQFADMGANDVAILHKQGKDLMLVYQLVRRMTMNVVFSTKVVERLGLHREMPLVERYRALKGLTIGITRPGAVTDMFARYFLKQAGLNPDRDAILLPVGGAAPLAAALRTGQIDAYLLSPPIPEGVGSVIINCSGGDVPELNDVPFVNLAVAKPYADAHPEVLRGYVRAVQRAIAWAGGHREQALAVLHGYFPDVAEIVLSRAWDDMAEAISADGTFSEQGVQSYLRIMVDMGQFVEMPPTAEGVLWTNRFTRDAATKKGND